MLEPAFEGVTTKELKVKLWLLTGQTSGHAPRCIVEERLLEALAAEMEAELEGR